MVLAVLGALAVAGGIALVYVPAGMIAGGLELLAAGYVVGYVEARREAA